MKNIRLFMLLAAASLLQGCSDDDNDILETATTGQAVVTLLVTPNGMGDNGYDDDAATGVFSFMKEQGTPVQLLQPDDMTQAETLYREWLASNAEKDSVVLVVGGAEYEALVQRIPPSLSGKGSRVLMYESDQTMAGVSTVMINRYGVSYLAGTMSASFDALIFAAAPGFSTLEESIAGFSEGYRAAGDGEYTLSLQYLADGEEGFALPDSALHVLSDRSLAAGDSYREIIFPLLGGSSMGVVKFLNDDAYQEAMMVGMDVDMAGWTYNIPFSMVVHIGDEIRNYLDAWKQGEEWPDTQRLGMVDGAVEIVINSAFQLHLITFDGFYGDEYDKVFVNQYQKYYDEAVRKEEEYENQ